MENTQGEDHLLRGEPGDAGSTVGGSDWEEGSEQDGSEYVKKLNLKIEIIQSLHISSIKQVLC